MKKRNRKLIKPDIQLKLIGVFLGVSVLAFLLQGLLLARQLSTLATRMPSGGSILQAEVPSLLVSTLTMSFLILLPLTLLVGIASTFRLAGPVYRFETWLRSIAAGEDPGPCRIRKGDQLQELCDVLNQAVDRLRDDARGETADEEKHAA